MNQKSPCLECNLLNEDKNNPECRDCSKRIEYDRSLGPPIYPLPGIINMNGKAGLSAGNVAEKNIEEIDKMLDSRESQHEKDEKIENLINCICKEYYIDADYLKSGGRKGRTHEARKKIVEKLMSKEFNLTQAKIAKLLGLSNNGVYFIIKRIREESKKDTISPAPAPKKITSKTDFETSNDYMILIKFEDHQEIYEKLIAIAADQFRTPENQILFMIKERLEAMEN